MTFNADIAQSQLFFTTLGAAIVTPQTNMGRLLHAILWLVVVTNVDNGTLAISIAIQPICSRMDNRCL